MTGVGVSVQDAYAALSPSIPWNKTEPPISASASAGMRTRRGQARQARRAGAGAAGLWVSVVGAVATIRSSVALARSFSSAVRDSAAASRNRSAESVGGARRVERAAAEGIADV